MIDLHSHILPGLDDGAVDLAVALRMAEAFVADGVSVVACTPHILPGVYHNAGPGIRDAAAELQQAIDRAGLPLRLVTGADVHIAPDLIGGLRSGRILSLADTRYVLIEPPHHVMPMRLEETFFTLAAAGYVPILTHPERLTWVHERYEVIEHLVKAGVWMQLTAGSLRGAFGGRARALSERMLHRGHVHILATDAHDDERRPPDLARGYQAAAAIVGEDEAARLVLHRPQAILENALPGHVEPPAPTGRDGYTNGEGRKSRKRTGSGADRDAGGGFAQRMRRLFGQ